MRARGPRSRIRASHAVAAARMTPGRCGGGRRDVKYERARRVGVGGEGARGGGVGGRGGGTVRADAIEGEGE